MKHLFEIDKILKMFENGQRKMFSRQKRLQEKKDDEKNKNIQLLSNFHHLRHFQTFFHILVIFIRSEQLLHNIIKNKKKSTIV